MYLFHHNIVNHAEDYRSLIEEEGMWRRGGGRSGEAEEVKWGGDGEGERGEGREWEARRKEEEGRGRGVG